DLFPGLIHANSAHLGSTQDQFLWEYAREHGFALLTKGKDFTSLSLGRGAPPKKGSCSASQSSERSAATYSIFGVRKDYRRSLLILKLRLTVTPQPPSSGTSADRESVLPFRTRICVRPRACALRARRCSGLSARA